jgi:hypothetical protein
MTSSQAQFPNQRNNPAAGIPTWPAAAAKFYYHTATATAGFQVYTGVGCLLHLIVNSPIASSTVTFYDGINTGGLVIASASTANFGFLEYGIQFLTGLFIVVTGTSDITITYLT